MQVREKWGKVGHFIENVVIIFVYKIKQKVLDEQILGLSVNHIFVRIFPPF